MCKNEILLSVIIPIYKVEEYIDRCVKSVLNQNLKDIEIILVDDGSPDRCPEICDDYALKDSRIKVIHKENGGLSDARNAGIDAATGKYIVLVDSDDFIVENSLEKIIPFTKNNPDIIVCDGETIGQEYRLRHFDEFRELSLSGDEFLHYAMIKGHMTMIAWLNIYKKDFLDKNSLRFRYGILHEDEEFTPRAFLKADSVVYSGVDFYRYVIRENSITTKKDRSKNLKDLYNTLCDLKPMYLTIENKVLKEILIDSLSSKYMSKYFDSDGFKYGKAYSHKWFVLKNAKRLRTKLKAILFCCSPKLYCKFNSISKK